MKPSECTSSEIINITNELGAMKGEIVEMVSGWKTKPPLHSTQLVKLMTGGEIIHGSTHFIAVDRKSVV